MIDKVQIRGLSTAAESALKVPQLPVAGQRVRVLRVLFTATDVGGGVVQMLGYAGVGVANNLIAAGVAEEFTG